jgi:cytochrome b6-f complex iron-sulfur subunit
MIDKSKMSVADMIAAARKADSKDGAAMEKPAPAAVEAAEPAAKAAASAAKPAAASAPAKTGASGKPSVADILAMARANKAGGSATSPAAPKEPPKPAPKPAAAKSASKKDAVPAPAHRLDTRSVLVAARGGTKPGPMTKAQAANKGQPVVGKKAPPKEVVVVPPMPMKPDYAKPAAARTTTAEVMERRAFLFGFSALAIGFSALTGALALWTLGSVRFMFPNILREPPSKFKVGFPDQFAPGQVEEKFKAQFGVWITNVEYKGKQEIAALKSVCTHLGCTPNWLEAEQKFKCPCHGSGFYKDGINFEGPAPRPLERYAISIGNDGQIEVDKSRTFHEEMGDWSDPASFIPV